MAYRNYYTKICNTCTKRKDSITFRDVLGDGDVCGPLREGISVDGGEVLGGGRAGVAITITITITIAIGVPSGGKQADPVTAACLHCPHHPPCFDHSIHNLL